MPAATGGRRAPTQHPWPQTSCFPYNQLFGVFLKDKERVANHKSALKAHKQQVRRRDHNRQLRSRLRGALRAVRTAIDNGDSEQSRAALRDTVSLIDKMAGKGLIHANAAARHNSRLTKRLGKHAAAA